MQKRSLAVPMAALTVAFCSTLAYGQEVEGFTADLQVEGGVWSTSIGDGSVANTLAASLADGAQVDGEFSSSVAIDGEVVTSSLGKDSTANTFMGSAGPNARIKGDFDVVLEVEGSVVNTSVGRDSVSTLCLATAGCPINGQ